MAPVTLVTAGNQWRQAEKEAEAAPRYEDIVGVRCSIQVYTNSGAASVAFTPMRT